MAAAASIAVNVFFVASGLLLGHSLLVRGEVLVLLCRTWIYPPLIVLTFFTAFAL